MQETPSLIPGSGRSTGEGIVYPLQYSWASLVAQPVKQSACNVGDLGSIPGLGRSPGEGKGYPLQYSGLEYSMGSQRVRHTTEQLSLSLHFHRKKKKKQKQKHGLPRWYSGKEFACYVGDARDQAQSLGQEDPLEESMATDSSILPGESPWTEEPGGLQSMGLQRVRQDGMTEDSCTQKARWPSLWMMLSSLLMTCFLHQSSPWRTETKLYFS